MKHNDEQMASGQMAGVARTLLVLKNYEWLEAEAKAIGVSIIPIKGIDLLQTVYHEQLDRHVRDIDVLCQGEAECRLLVERLCREHYRLEFPFSMRPEVLAAKQKVSLLSNSPTMVNIDVHLAFVTKKFFSQTIGTFNVDALARCHEGRMDEYDRWLFLAQHAAFHLFSDVKWTRDLAVLYLRYSPEQKTALRERAVCYGFRRVMVAAVYQLRKMMSPQESDTELHALQLSASERRFLSFLRQFDRPFSRKPFDRFIAAWWEFAFIHSRGQRLSSWFRLVFPSKGNLSNIYRINKPVLVVAYYPLHFFISFLSGCFFWLLYAMYAKFSGE